MFSPTRSLRRTNPITLVLAALLTVSVIVFLYGSASSSSSSTQTQLKNLKQAAHHYLSPPSLPFKKASLSRSSDSRDGLDKPAPPVVHYHMNNVTTSANPIANRETVLILTPLAKFYQAYWDNILALDYPHDLISLGFIIPKGREGNAANLLLQDQIQKTQRGPAKKRFRCITVLRQDTEDPLRDHTEHERHKMENQKARRAAMAKSRNSLVFTVLGPETAWVLWLDGDIVETPATLIQDLAAHDKPIITANTFQRFYNPDKKAMDTRPYDFNNWVDSENAQEIAKGMAAEDVLFEGYSSMATYRTLMAYLPGKNSDDPKFEVELDGVGGAALLVKAEVHRDGASFPAFPFYHLIETEGFAKMARRLGWKSFGLPNYYVYHYNE